jgi:large subunit ribosomal protein L30
MTFWAKSSPIGGIGVAGGNTAISGIKAMTASKLKVTQVKSSFGRLARHRACLIGLGLRKVGHQVVLENTPSVRGMVNKVEYMIRVEEA